MALFGNDAGVFTGGWRAERLRPVHVNVFAVRSALVGLMLLVNWVMEFTCLINSYTQIAVYTVSATTGRYRQNIFFVRCRLKQ